MTPLAGIVTATIIFLLVVTPTTDFERKLFHRKPVTKVSGLYLKGLS